MSEFMSLFISLITFVAPHTFVFSLINAIKLSLEKKTYEHFAVSASISLGALVYILINYSC